MVDAADLLNEFVPQAGQATAGIGGSIVPAEPRAREKELQTIWQALHSDSNRPPLPPSTGSHSLPDRLGPFNWNPIVFGGGVPVGGWAQLTLFRNGAVNFSGHFHVSGAPSYNVACAFAVRSGDGTIFTFTHTGRVHGTFESGSRNDDWDQNPTQTAVAADWPSLSASWSWHANAGANADIGQLLDQTEKALGQAAKVIAIIA